MHYEYFVMYVLLLYEWSHVLPVRGGRFVFWGGGCLEGEINIFRSHE